MDYSTNKSDILSVQMDTKRTPDNECKNLTLSVLARQYSSFVFLVCMKYLKDEEKSKHATINIFKAFFNRVQETELNDIKACLYQETKKYCISDEM